jgi:hypothetical protein
MHEQFQVVFDAEDPRRLAEFWAIALHYELELPPPEYDSWEEFADKMGIPEEDRDKMAALVPKGKTGNRILFQKVPEPKTAKNRVHIDVPCGVDRHLPKLERLAGIEAKVAELVEAGGTEIGSRSEWGAVWTVMEDPEGNEFCVV